jgi:hypothetical protein
MWLSVLDALSDGRLGCSAKTTPPSADERNSVIIVYTRYWEDREDVLRVALELFKLMPTWSKVLCYKTDVHTRAGVYAKDGPTSLYKITHSETQLTVDEGVLAQARAMVDDEDQGAAGGAEQQEVRGTWRARDESAPAASPPGAAPPVAATAVKVICLISDSDGDGDDPVALSPPAKAAKTSPQAA